MADSNPTPTASAESAEKMDGCRTESLQEDSNGPTSQSNPEEIERKARIDAMWQQMNKGVPAKKSFRSVSENQSSTVKKPPTKNPVQKSSTGWMNYLGLGSKMTSSSRQAAPDNRPSVSSNSDNEEAKKIAAAALSAVKDAAAASANIGKGKVEITEVRDFAGEEIEVKKVIDADSKEANEKGKGAAGSTSAVDAILEQIKKKTKLSVLDKTKKDWGEYKGENKGLEDELDAYKKSSNQYLDKVSFLERADYREFERERDVRLSLQAKRKTDMRE